MIIFYSIVKIVQEFKVYFIYEKQKFLLRN